VRTGNPGSGENRKSGIWWESDIRDLARTGNRFSKKIKHFIPPPLGLGVLVIRWGNEMVMPSYHSSIATCLWQKPMGNWCPYVDEKNFRPWRDVISRAKCTAPISSPEDSRAIYTFHLYPNSRIRRKTFSATFYFSISCFVFPAKIKRFFYVM
jgi:hypothetical protein